MNSQNRTSEHLDEELVARVQQGDKKAYDLLVIKYQHKIVQLVNRYLKDPSEAQDVAQEAFIKAYRAIGSFRGESTFYTWLYRIATNESLTFLEQQKKKSAISLSDVESGLSNKIKADEGFDANRLEWKLQLAIQQLPERQRLVFNLRYYDEMPYEKMSAILETSEGALKASYHHAAKKIEDFIKNH